MAIDDQIHQYIIMQGFQPSSEAIDAVERGDEVNQDAIFQLAEEQHQQRPQPQQQNQQPAPNHPNFITQVAPEDEEEDEEDEEEDNTDGVNLAQEPAVQPVIPPTASNPGEDTHLPSSLFTLFLASLNVQRDVPNRPSFPADRQSQSDYVAALDDCATVPAETEAPGNSEINRSGAQQQPADSAAATPSRGSEINVSGAQQQPADSEAATPSRGSLVEGLQQAPTAIRRTQFHRQQQADQTRSLLACDYTYESLFASNEMLFPMPTNSRYLNVYEDIVQNVPAAFRDELWSLFGHVDPIVSLGFRPGTSLLSDWEATIDNLAADPVLVKRFAPLLKYLATVIKKEKREQKKKHSSGMGGGGGEGDDHGGGDDDDGDDDDDDDDYSDFPEEQDSNDPADDGSQPGLFEQLKKEREKRESKRMAFQQYRLANILLDYILHHVSRQGLRLRQAHVISRNNARNMNEALAQITVGKKINVSPHHSPQS
jgi:hypothetical protein